MHSMLRHLVLALFVFSILIPTGVHATTDLFLPQQGITFSKDLLLAGDTVRIYAKVRNSGDQDVEGYVTFYQGDQLIGRSQVISVRANGATDEVFVDFVVPAAPFNIRADIQGTDPPDVNVSNNSFMTPLLTPVLDDDRDGTPNSTDNCPTQANADQANFDEDAVGDLCDDDDDNDGLTDSMETELGTHPRKADSDGDGIADKEDYYPKDPMKSLKEIPTPVVVVPPVVAAEPTPMPVTPAPKKTTVTVGGASDESVAQVQEEMVQEPVIQNAITFSAKSVFSYKRAGWNRFAFTAEGPDITGYQYEWNFGDGVKSRKRSVEHSYSGSGVYAVTLSVIDPAQRAAEDTAIVSVPFFSLQNRVVISMVAFLTVLLVLGLLFAYKMYIERGGRLTQTE